MLTAVHGGLAPFHIAGRALDTRNMWARSTANVNHTVPSMLIAVRGYVAARDNKARLPCAGAK